MYGKPVTLPGIAMVWGLTIMVMIYSIGQVSGAHFNPAVSIALASSRKFPFKQNGETGRRGGSDPTEELTPIPECEPIRSSADTKKERSRHGSLSEAKAKSLGGRSLKHPWSASMASLGEIEESNDLVNHTSRELGEQFLKHRLIDSWSPRLEEERHMKKLPSETEETRKVKEIFGLQEKKENCWTFFAAAAQVYGGRIHESVESVEMISSYEIRATSIRKKGVGAVLDLQSQGVCDYMHWSLGSLHVLQVIGTESIVEQKGFSHWFSMRLSQDLVRVFTVFLRAIYMMVFLVSVKGVAEGLKGIDLGGHMRENKCVYKVSQLQRIESKGFWFEAVVIQVLQKLQVGEIIMRDFQGMQQYLQEREDSRYLKGRHTHIKSKLGLRRRNQRSSISHELKVFQRSHGMKVILAKDDQQILELH
uniref:Aquaporin n=1 Tax=Brassica oleracea var. oleracea TaxID=109376 RepID=A0A0D3CGW4_BRAOL